jgi:hypothetical protein
MTVLGGLLLLIVPLSARQTEMSNQKGPASGKSERVDIAIERWTPDEDSLLETL